jgi:phage shock protein PspC (stress-responsive transcriptional regulator)
MKKLYLSNADRKIGGVCGGLGEYFDVDPTVLRVIFLISCFLGGLGLIVYLVMWLVVPRNPKNHPM